MIRFEECEPQINRSQIAEIENKCVEHVRGVSIGKINDATVCTLLSIGITYQLRSDMLQRC